jgi:hypothetical protein
VVLAHDSHDHAYAELRYGFGGVGGDAGDLDTESSSGFEVNIVEACASEGDEALYGGGSGSRIRLDRLGAEAGDERRTTPKECRCSSTAESQISLTNRQTPMWPAARIVVIGSRRASMNVNSRGFPAASLAAFSESWSY